MQINVSYVKSRVARPGGSHSPGFVLPHPENSSLIFRTLNVFRISLFTFVLPFSH